MHCQSCNDTTPPFKVLDDPAYQRSTLGEYLSAKGYSDAFQTGYVLPMCAAVWSVPATQVRDFPLVSLVRFWVNHHLLQVMGRPVWRVVAGRSKSYVDAVLKSMPSIVDDMQLIHMHITTLQR